jgi:hypothetical protein
MKIPMKPTSHRHFAYGMFCLQLLTFLFVLEFSFFLQIVFWFLLLFLAAFVFLAVITHDLYSFRVFKGDR